MNTQAIPENIRVRTQYSEYWREWQAWDEATYDGLFSPIGFGLTEQAAITDLLEKLRG